MCFSKVICFSGFCRELVGESLSKCDHLYSDPFGHFGVLDLKCKYMKGEKLESHEKTAVGLLDWIGLFDCFKHNPRAVVHDGMFGSSIFIELDVDHPGLEKIVYPSVYIKNHPEYLPKFINQCKEKPELNPLMETLLFSYILSQSVLVGRHTALPHRIIDLEFTDEELSGFSQSFSDEYMMYRNYPKEKEIVQVDYSESMIMKDMEIAATFINEHGGVVSGSAAFAFFNITNPTVHTARFIPDDIDIVLTDKDVYEGCKEKYIVTEYRHEADYDDGVSTTEITYVNYMGRKINLILTDKKVEEKVSEFDMEFCSLIWDGKGFDRSSVKAVTSAYYGRSTYKLKPNGDITRPIKYMKRGYDVIIL